MTSASDEWRTRREEVAGYSRFGRGGAVPEWDGSLESLARTAGEHARDPQWISAIALLEISGGMMIMDCGAGRCWASFLLAKEGCDVVAVDFNMDEVVGLRAGRKLRNESGVGFHIVCADLEHLPFREGVFDRAIGSQFLHHAFSLDGMVREIARTIRTGGRFLALNEHTLPVRTRTDAGFRASHPAAACGANEHAYHYSRYSRAIASAGLKLVESFPYPHWEGYLGGGAGRSGSDCGMPCTLKQRIKRFFLRILSSMNERALTRGMARWLVRSMAMTSFSYLAVREP